MVIAIENRRFVEDRNRTGTVSLLADFKSTASTNFATPTYNNLKD